MLNLMTSRAIATGSINHSTKKTAFVLATTVGFLMLWLPAIAQSPQPPHSLVVSGHTGIAPLIQVSGKSYVSVEDLARLTQGSLSFQPDQIVLSLSGVPPSETLTSAPAAKQGFSRDFLRSAIEAMSVIRELRIEIVNAIQNNYPLSADWVADQRRKADTSLALVSAAISTDDDRSAYPLLTGQYANVRKFTDNFLAARGNAQYIDPSSVDNDPLNQQITACSQALSAMAADNRFHDAPSCH